MASLKHLKIRKTTVQSIEKVTHAMKLVSASKLRKAREASESSIAYMEVLNGIMGYVYKEMHSAQRVDLFENFPLLFGRDQKKCLLLVIGADRGLCGAFNNNVAKEAKRGIRHFLHDGKEIRVLCIGEKVYRLMKDAKGAEILNLEQLPTTTEEIKDFSKDLVASFYRGEFDLCHIYYTHFVSPISQTVMAQTLIPLQEIIEKESDTNEELNILECHPDPILLLKDLIPQLLNDALFSILQDSIASEHAARMTAMDNATRSADEMIESLKAEYNKKRQAGITTELVEIISGAEVINQQL